MTAYYNELDPFAAQWLRNLIAAGHIAQRARLEGHGRHDGKAERWPVKTGSTTPAGVSDFWTDAEWVQCSDGKARLVPTEPALFPLVDGMSNRVGLLRGAGNAIVPQVAAEVIKAFLEYAP